LAQLAQNKMKCELHHEPALSRKHICKPTRANTQTKGLQKSFRLSSLNYRLSGRFLDCQRSKKQNKFVLRGLGWCRLTMT